MATGSKGPEGLTGTRGEGISRRKALGALGILGFTGLAAVTAACSTSKPELPHEQQGEPMPHKDPSHDTSQGVVTCDRKKGLIRVVDPKEAQRDPQRYSLRPEDCREGGAPSNVDPLPPAAPASPTNTPPAGK